MTFGRQRGYAYTPLGRSGEMADAADSKSASRKGSVGSSPSSGISDPTVHIESTDLNSYIARNQ